MNLCKRTKICRVCGDVAFAFNFSGLSCEPCKAFFRRNVLQEKELECKLENNCLVDISSRKFCQRCRMDKCLAIGMRKEHFTMFDKIYKLQDIPKNIINQELQPFDLLLINEIEEAVRHLPNEHKLPLVGHSCDVLYLANIGEIYARRAIKFCKSIESFRCLQPKDQLQLMKSFYPEFTAIQLSFIYMEEKDGLRLMNETGQKTIFMPMGFSDNPAAKAYSRTFRKFAFPLRAIMNNDTTMRNLIIAHLLFKPRNNTACPEFINYNYSIYSHLLWKYSRFKFKATGDKSFYSLLEILGQIGEPSKINANYFQQEYSPNELPEIIRDIYDIRI